MPTIYPATDLGFSTPPWASYEHGSGNASLADNANASGTTGSDNGWAGVTNRIASMGFKWIRMDMCLDVSSRVNEMDHMVNDAIAKGLKIIAVAVEGPGGSHAFSGGIANWVNLVLNRYGTKISAIEFGNELNAGNKAPNYSGVAGDPTPEAFAPVMQQAFNACRANTTNPNVVVLVGSVTSHFTNDTTKTGTYGIRPQDWWTRFIGAAQSYKVGGQFPWDGAACHPYCRYFDADRDPNSSIDDTEGMNQVTAIHNVMANAGDPGRLWVTEFGYTSLATQASNIPTWFSHMISSWRNLSYTGPFMVYDFDGASGTDEGNAGAIVGNDGTGISTVATHAWYSTLTSLATADNVPPIGDSTHPYPYVAQPHEGDQITIGTTYTLIGAATDAGSGIDPATTSFTITGPSYLASIHASLFAGYDASWNTTGLSPGQYEIQFTAKDLAGNGPAASGTGQVSGDFIHVTLVGPSSSSATITTPTTGSTQGSQSGTHTSVVSLAATATDTQIGVSSAQFNITGGSAPIVATPASVNTLYTNNFTSPVTFSTGYLTSGGRDDSPAQDYTQSVTGGVFRVSAPAGNTDGNIVKAYWPSTMVPVVDSEILSTWAAQSGPLASASFSQGHAHRIVGSGNNIQAVVVSKNVFAAAYWIFNFDVYDSLQPAGSQFTAIGDQLVLNHFNPSSLPWLMRSRVYGNVFQVKVWLSTDTEPAWGDPNFGSSVTIPSTYVQPGVCGLVAGHIPASGTMDFDNLTISDVTSWTASYDTNGTLSDGPHTVTFTATNGLGATFDAPSVDITLQNTTAGGGGGGGPVVQGTPLIQVAFGVRTSDTPASTDWVDVSSYVRSFSFKTPSRNRDLDLFQPGSAQITFDNRDRRFDPTYASSPYAPNVVPLVRVQIAYIGVTGIVTPLFTGLVEGWPQTYVENRDATVTVNCVDGFNLLSRGRPLASPWKMTVDVDQPDHWWRLDDPNGSLLARDFAGGAHGTHVGGVLGEQDPIIAHDDGKCVHYTVGSTYTNLPGSAAPSGTTWTAEAWVKLDWPPTDVQDPGTSGHDYVTFPVWYFGNGTDSVELYMLYGRTLTVKFGDGTNTTLATAPFTLAQPHHVVVTRSGNVLLLYLDGVAVGLGGVSSSHVTPTTMHRLHADFASTTEGHTPGFMSDFAIYDGVALTPQQIASHYQAGRDGWDGDQAGNRVLRILKWMGWPSGLTNVDIGLSQLGPATWGEGDDPLQVLQTLTQTCYAAMYIDPAGNLRWRDRVALLTGTRATQPQTVFADARAFNIPYQDIQPNQDWQEVYNEVQISRDGGVTQIVNDATSQAAYGRLTLSLTGQMQRTDNEANDFAAYLLSRRKDPKVRVDNITVTRGTSSSFVSVLGLKLEDRVTVNRTPQKITPAMTQDCLIDGFSHTFNASEPNGWQIQLTLSDAAPAVSYFTLDRSTLDGPDVLAF